MIPNVGGGDDVGNGGNKDDKVVQFPSTDAERKALRKAREDLERQRLVNVFIDEQGSGDQALFRSREGIALADLIVAGHRETWRVRSLQFRHHFQRYLQRQFDRLVNEGEAMLAVAIKQAIKKTAVNEAIDSFEHRAVCSNTIRDVHVRVAGNGVDEIFIDLVNDSWEVVHITAAGWRVIESPPVRFERSAGMLPLPYPTRGGNIEALRPLLNTTDADFPLVVAYLLAAFYPKGPYPIWVMYAQSGAAKTTFLRRLKALVDPHVVPTSALPRGERELFIAARNSHLLMFENISELSKLMSDALCRLATGAGLRPRKLFKDADEVYFKGARPIGMEGIPNVIERSDLQSRAIVTQLDAIREYKQERKLDPEFERQQPAIFGALCTMLSRGLQMLPSTKLISPPPRMTDFAHWATACGVENFEAIYAANLQNAVNVMLANDELAKSVRALVAKKKFTGRMEDLLKKVGPSTKIKSTRKLSDELRRLIPALKSVGVVVTFHQRQAEYRGFTIEQQ